MRFADKARSMGDGWVVPALAARHRSESAATDTMKRSATGFYPESRHAP